MLPLRLCYLTLDCLFNEKCDKPISPWKDFTNTVTSGFNISLVRKPSSLYSPTNAEGKNIDDCLRSIQQNESDAVLLPYTMPVILNNVKTGPVFFSDKIVIGSTYAVEKNNLNPGILDTFDAFGVDACALILNFFVILAVLICLTYILERKSPRRQIRINGRRFNLRFVPWFIFCFFVKQFPSFPGNMTTLKVLLTWCLLTYSYFVTYFYSSMIKTDMVTVKAPLVINSYQDIVDDLAIEPYIWYKFDEYKSFRDAPSGSLKKKIWERILKMGVNKLVLGRSSMQFYSDKHPFMHTKAVIIAYSSVANFAKYSYGIYLKKLEKSCKKSRKFLFVSDPTDSLKLSTTVLNRISSEAVSQRYERRMKRFFEGHFWDKMVDNSGLQSVKLLAPIFGAESDISDVDNYAGQKVILSEPVLITADITYFMFLFTLHLILCCIQFIVFLIERWVSMRN